MSFATLGFISGLAILGGVLWGYHSYKAHATGFMDWLKPLILVVFGVLLLIYPIPGVASLALLLAMYLLMDAYGSFALAHARYPAKGWGWMTFNGIMDIGLAALFLFGWPEYSILLVGIFVAVSLIFDGWALVVIGWAMHLFGRSARYDEPIDIAPGIRATFIDAGHILGSASIVLELEENGRRKTVLFSGDLGYSGRPLLRGPAPPPPVDVVVMETTYGDRLHKALQPSIEELYGAVLDTFARGGNVVIPTFALERAQEILYFLHEGVAQGRLPGSIQVFLDSPMAISATEIFERHPECYNGETAVLFGGGKDPFSVPGLHFTRETAESIALNRITGGAILMAGSGMCTGGRVWHHLKHNLWRANSSVIFVGYAAKGTLARRIVDGAKTVRIFHEEIEVRAKIYTIGGFSAHADHDELLAWHRHTGQPERTILVHGEAEAMQCFATHLQGTSVEMPAIGDEIEL